VSHPESAPPLLELRGVSGGYLGRDVVRDVSLVVRPGEVVTLLGHNGAGKTTTLLAALGVVRPSGGQVLLDGEDITGLRPTRTVRRGLSFTPAEHFVFDVLTTQQNLEIAGRRSDPRDRDARMARALELFPVLGERLDQVAGTMSGGQQRMLSVAMAMLTGPRVMLLDEPSLGLAPKLAETMMDTLRRLIDEDGLSILLVEQNVGQALRHADRAYVLRSGAIIHAGPAEELRERGSWWDLF
jgi:branched-chain amino acid transport system ATP-binding protein